MYEHVHSLCFVFYYFIILFPFHNTNSISKYWTETIYATCIKYFFCIQVLLVVEPGAEVVEVVREVVAEGEVVVVVVVVVVVEGDQEVDHVA